MRTRCQQTWDVDHHRFIPLFTHLTTSVEPLSCSRHVCTLHGDTLASSLEDESDSLRWRSDGEQIGRENRKFTSPVAEVGATGSCMRDGQGLIGPIVELCFLLRVKGSR